MGMGYVADSEGVIGEPGDQKSNYRIFRPSVLGLGKESSFSELQWLVDSVILETDKMNLCLSVCLSLSAEEVEYLVSGSGSCLVSCLHLFGPTPAPYTCPLSHTFLQILGVFSWEIQSWQ